MVEKVSSSSSGRRRLLRRKRHELCFGVSAVEVRVAGVVEYNVQSGGASVMLSGAVVVATAQKSVGCEDGSNNSALLLVGSTVVTDRKDKSATKGSAAVVGNEALNTAATDRSGKSVATGVLMIRIQGDCSG
jgi:hypothetical protein